MKLKDGVVLSGLRPELKAALPVLEKVFQEQDVEMVITSTTDDSPRRDNPAHREGRAVDMRAHQVNPYMLPLFRQNMEKALGTKWVVKAVIFYPEMARTHIHAEIKA